MWVSFWGYGNLRWDGGVTALQLIPSLSCFGCNEAHLTLQWDHTVCKTDISPSLDHSWPWSMTSNAPIAHLSFLAVLTRHIAAFYCVFLQIYFMLRKNNTNEKKNTLKFTSNSFFKWKPGDFGHSRKLFLVKAHESPFILYVLCI